MSLNGVKRGFASAAVTAKGMFGSIKAGLISTGIGAFLVIIGSLFAYFKSTKRGAEMLERALAGVGAVVGVVTDLFSSIGDKMVGAFSDPKQAVIDLWEAIKTNLMNRVTGIADTFMALGDIMKAAFSLDWDAVEEGANDLGVALIQVGTGMDEVQQKEFVQGIKDIATEIDTEVAAAMRLKGILQKLKDEEREFSKIRAQTRQDIQKARLDALDESKTAEERLAALQKANDLELSTTAKSLEMQQKKIKVQKETMALSENMASDLDELATLEVGLIDLQTQSFQTQKRLATEMETLTNEMAAKRKADKKLIDDEKAENEKIRIATEKLDLQALTDWNLSRIKGETDEEFKIRIKAAKELAKEEMALDKLKEKTKKDSIKMGFSAAKGLATEGSNIAKGIAVAETIYNTQTAIMAAMKLPAPFNAIQAVATGAMGLASIQKILSTSPASASGGGSVNVPSTPAPQMMSGAFDISGGVEPEPVEAFVVTDSMTNSQNQLANIRRRATI